MKLIVWKPKERNNKNYVLQHGQTWELIEEKEDQFFLRSLTFSVVTGQAKYSQATIWVDKNECEEWGP